MLKTKLTFDNSKFINFFNSMVLNQLVVATFLFFFCKTKIMIEHAQNRTYIKRIFKIHTYTKQQRTVEFVCCQPLRSFRLLYIFELLLSPFVRNIRWFMLFHGFSVATLWIITWKWHNLKIFYWPMNFFV